MQSMTATTTFRNPLTRFLSGASLAPVAAIMALVTLSACGSSNEPAAPPAKDVTPASITASTTDTLRAAVGAAVATPLSVTVKNKAGDLLTGITVTFAVATGGGALSATSVTTSASGVATTTWTLGSTPGTQTVTASAGTLTPVTFVAIASIGAASAMTKVAGGDAQSVAVGTNIPVAPSVKVADSFGNPVANVLVTFAVASGGGTVTGGAVNTDATGIAKVGAWKLGPTVGPNTLTASATGLTTLTFTATGVAGPIAQVKFTNAAPILVIGGTFKFTTQTLDANNNVVTGATVLFSSDNVSVATVDATGTVTATGAGTANITVAFGAITAVAPVNVIGHPSGTVLASLPMAAPIKGIAIVGKTAFASLAAPSSLTQVDLPTQTQSITPAVLTGTPTDAAAGGTGPTVAVPVSGPLPLIWFVNPTTQLRTDSIEIPLAINPSKAVMNSTGTKLFVDLTSFNLLTIDVASRTISSTISLFGTVQAMKMAFGDTLIYAATALGTVFEIDARTSTIKRQFILSGGVADLDISRDGKTLFTASGASGVVTMTPLAAGGLSGPVDFSAVGGNVFAVALSPDGQQLWVGMNGKVFAAPAVGNSFSTILVSSSIPIAGSVITRIVFSPLGDFAVALDNSGNNLVILR